MKTFKEFAEIIEESTDSTAESSRVKVGDTVSVQHRSMSGRTMDRGEHKVTKVTKTGFHIDRLDAAGKPMKFKHSGYGGDYKTAKSARVKGAGREYGHLIKSLTDPQ